MKKNTNKKSLQMLDVFSFLLGFQGALIAYVMSSFLEENSGLKNVGIFFFIAYAASLLVITNLHHLVKRYGKSKVFLVFLLLKGIALFGTGFFYDSSLGTIFAVWTLFAGPLMWIGLDILIESFSQNKVTGTIRGLHLTIMNTGWLIAPFLAGWILSEFGFRWIYLVSSFTIFVVVVFVMKKFPHVNHNIKKDLQISAVIKKFYKQRNIARISYVSLVLEIFYAVMVIYTPLYLLDQGLSWTDIGKIFTVMLLPFVLFQYPFGKMADTKTGEKELLMVAILMMAVTTGIIYFIEGTDIIVWMIVLFSTRVGAAIVEILRDSYFYKQVQPEDVDLIDFFRTTRSLAYILAPGFFSIFSVFLSTKTLFLLLAFFVVTALVPLWNLKDTK